MTNHWTLMLVVTFSSCFARDRRFQDAISQRRRESEPLAKSSEATIFCALHAEAEEYES